MAKQNPGSLLKGGKKMRTPKFRASFLYAFNPSVREDDNGKVKKSWEVTMLLPKKSTDLSLLKQLCEEAAVAKWGKLPKKLTLPFNCGSEHDEDSDSPYSGYSDKVWSVRAWSTRAPKTIVDENREEIEDEDEIYSGAFYKAIVDAFAWETKGKKGVSLGFLGLQKIADGERLGGGATSSANDFEEEGEDEDEDEDF